MSRPDTDLARTRPTRAVELPICDYCGGYILDDDQPCPALDEEVCYP